jgi:holliday junction DNA helicase RuvA
VILELKAKAPGVMAHGAGLASAAVAEDVVVVEDAPAPKRPARADEGSMKRAAAAADALSALVNLGYGQGDAAQAVATVAGDMVEADAAGLIRAALKVLAPK